MEESNSVNGINKTASVIVILLIAAGLVYYFGFVKSASESPKEDANSTEESASGSENSDDSDMAGSEKQDAVVIASETIMGTWQSVDDEKFVREFKADSLAEDKYEGEVVSSGLWVVFDKMNAPEITFPLDENSLYLQMTMTGTQADTLTFKVDKLTETELELTYMDRGGVLRFKRVE